jgi:hypothetical protein
MAKGGPDFGGGNRPDRGQGNRPDFGKGERPGIGQDNRPGLGKGERPGIGQDNRPDLGRGDRPAIAGNNRGNVVVGGDVNIGNRNSINYAQNRQGWIDNRHATGNQVRVNAGNRYAGAYASGAYRRGVVGGYPYYGGWAGRGSYYGWRAASYATVGAFLGGSFAAAVAQPAYYGYGLGGNVYYQDNSVYVNDQAVGTPEQYEQQAMSLVSAAPAQTTDTEWLPLGVFAFTREDVDDSQGVIELAINKEGVLAGTYYNEATGVSRSLKGTLDQKSQRVAVGFADGKNTDMALETGLYNLTQDEAPGLLHRGSEESTPVLLVRLQPPADNQQGQ